MAGSAVLRVDAFAKVNLTLRVLGVRSDGYHELRTTFQTLALHDTLTFTLAPGPFTISCDTPACPVDERNLVWRASELVWRAAGRRGALRGLRVHLVKRIPLEGGLGGGSSNAAATLRALTALWRVPPKRAPLPDLARELGADVPFLLQGGTAVGFERGDVLFPLADLPRSFVVLALPPFGVSTKSAYAWWDAYAEPPAPRPIARPTTFQLPVAELCNDLEAPVTRQHPEIGQLVEALTRDGASYAAMSGSGSTVFGLFNTLPRAQSAAKRLATRTLITTTLSRPQFTRRSAPRSI